MPGIIAIIDSKSDRRLVGSMARSIAHERWHQTDLYLKPPLALARVHLGISNPEAQPIFNEDESVLIMMHGEVFGYEEEKKRLESNGHIFKFDSDPEFCLHLYEEYGDDFVQKLNGCFILVIFDVRRERVLIANDRHGLLPFYFTQIDNKYIFASEVKAILKDQTFNKEIDHEAVADFFAFGRIFGDRTFFSRVKVMPPASTITWSKGKLSKKRYWDFKYEEECDPDLTEAYYVKTLASLFRKAVERTAKRGLRFGVFLSGGLDSRATAAALYRKGCPLNTFTYGIRGGDEAQIAKKIAENLGTKHEFIELRSDYLVSLAQKGVYLTDGMLNCANFHWINFALTVRQHADVMFHGLGLDILLSTVLSHTMYLHFYGGGPGLLLERQLSEAEEDLFADLLYSFFNSLVTEEMMPHFFTDTYYQKIKKYPHQSFDRHLSMVREKDPVNKLDSFWLRTFGRYNLSRVILRNYSEDRVPSLDNDFFEFALKLPRKLRFRRQRLYFKFLAELAPELAKIPYQRTGVALTMPMLAQRIGFLVKGGYKLLTRKLRAKTHGFISLPNKMGYPDLDDWIRRDGNLGRFFESILLDKKTLARGYFNPDFVTQMVKDHISGRKDWGMQLCALLTFELWNRLFIDESVENELDPPQ